MRQFRGGVRGGHSLLRGGGGADGGGAGLPLSLEAALPLLRLSPRSAAAQPAGGAATLPLRRLRFLRLGRRRLRQRGAETTSGGRAGAEAVHPHQGLHTRCVIVRHLGPKLATAIPGASSSDTLGLNWPPSGKGESTVDSYTGHRLVGGRVRLTVTRDTVW